MKFKRVHLAKLLAVPLVGVAVCSHHPFPEDSLLDLGTEAAGYLFLVLSALGRLWAAVFISGRKNAVLVTEGPYSMVRNPLYFCSLLGFVGAGLALESITLATCFGVLFFVTHWPVILREERRLGEICGEAFDRYKATVPRFLPHPWKFQPLPQTVTISPAAFSRAMMESFMLLCVFYAADLLERLHVTHPETVLFHLP